MNDTPSSNASLCSELIRDGILRVRPLDALAGEVPPLEAMPDPDRIAGMLLGLAVGDSLGNTSESLRPAARRMKHGEIRDYLPNKYAGGRAVGLPTDDTQLAFRTLEEILRAGGVDPEKISHRFTRDPIFGMGHTVRDFLLARALGKSWREAGQESAGNGALMRVAPLVLPSLRQGGLDFLSDAALGAAITHNDSAAVSSCVACAVMLRDLLAMDGPPGPRWWTDRFRDLAAAVETEKEYASRAPACADFRGRLTEFVREEVGRAVDDGTPVLDACERWYSGAYLLETVPSVLVILARHAADPEEAIVRAVNDTVDNDTIAAIVGMAVGALHGRRGLPKRWLDGLLGRTGVQDDGAVFELVERALGFVASQFTSET